MNEILFQFLSENPCKVTFENQWLIVNKDETGFYFLVFRKDPTAKRATQLYEGSHFANALWCLKEGHRYA